jgi:hypothetical protein
VILDKAGILAQEATKVETVQVPEWQDGASVCVRALRGWERDKFDQFGQDAREKKDLSHFRAKLVSLCLCDEGGKSLDFTEADMIALSNKSAAALDRVFDACRALSGMTRRDVEEVEKN